MLTCTEDNKRNWLYNELPTPQSEKECLEIIKHNNHKILNWLSEDNWSLIEKRKNVILESKEEEDSDVNIVRGNSIVKNINIEKLAKVFFSPTFEERKILYDELLLNNIIEFNDNHSFNITHSQFDAPMGIKGREFVTIKSCKKLENGGYLISTNSINYKDIPFSKKFIRGINKSGVLLNPILINGKQAINIITVDHIDPKGWIPPIVTNLFKSKIMDRLEHMNELYKKLFI
jgi:hypothetical protein